MLTAGRTAFGYAGRRRRCRGGRTDGCRRRFCSTFAAPWLVLVVRMLLLVQLAQSLGLLDEGPLVVVTQHPAVVNGFIDKKSSCDLRKPDDCVVLRSKTER